MKKRAGNPGLLRKAIVTAIVTVVFAAISATILIATNSLLREAASTVERVSQAGLVTDLYNRESKDLEKYADRLLQDVTDSAQVMAAALQELQGDNGYEGPRVFNNAAVVEVRDTELLIPEGAPSALSQLDAGSVLRWSEAQNASFDMVSFLGEDNGLVEDELVVFGAAHLTDGLYYLTWSPYFEDLSNLIEHYGAYGVLNTVECTYDAAILVAYPHDGILDVINASERMSEIASLSDLGLTEDDLLSGEPRLVTYRGTSYDAVIKEASDPGTYVVTLFALGDAAVRAAFTTTFVIGFMLVVLVAYASYLFFAQKYVKDKILDDRHSSHYTPKALRLTAITCLVLTTALIFTATAFIDSVSVLHDRADRNDTIIEGLFKGLKSHQESKDEYLTITEEQWFITQAQRIATLIAEYPEVATQAMLQRVSEQLGCDYVMLFDSTGRQKLSSNSYTGFTLGNGQGTNADDFRRLLRGITSIYHAPSRDALTGLYDAYVGVPVRNGEAAGATGDVLILAIPSSLIEAEASMSSFDDLLSTITPDNAICFAIDPQTKKVVYTSEEGLTGTIITDDGFSESSLRNGYMDFVNLSDGRYFTRTVQRDDLTFMYGTTTFLALSTVPALASMAAVTYAVLFVVISVIMLHGYTNEVFEAWRSTGDRVDDGQLVEVVSADGKRIRTVDPSHRWSFAPITWKDLIPERKMRSVLIALLVAFCFACFLVTRKEMSVTKQPFDLTSYILFGDWLRGFNLFALCAVLIVVTICFLLIEVSRIVLQLLSLLFDSRGETVCRLVYSLLKYFFVLAALYYSFGYLGFDARTRLTSLGIVSIALSLGAQTLVADIIAGIFIVFEGEFQVGDIIDVGGYRGTVLEIGVRSTKLMGRGYNIKIIDNRDIKNVLNMTHLSSWYPLEIKVPTIVPTKRMEEILERELPKIGEAHEDIIVSGPLYKGITSIQTGLPFPAVGYSILTECREENYHKVERLVNGEVMRILEEEEIPLRM